ncbi:hypothetical protein KSP40_PGU011040 [Platanthera guangdongensis]|uniref:Uncharacterized protein n=1 Tax=Platanthera guangdongensis TaxID=2320717 RepID=A0ABR2M7T1_9ASPA
MTRSSGSAEIGGVVWDHQRLADMDRAIESIGVGEADVAGRWSSGGCDGVRASAISAFPGWWSGGFTYGLWIGILVASGFSVVPISSRLWKDQFQLYGSSCGKDDSRKTASILFPSMRSLLKRKKDHGRAEALLIAACGKGLKLQPEDKNISDFDSIGSYDLQTLTASWRLEWHVLCALVFVPCLMLPLEKFGAIDLLYTGGLSLIGGCNVHRVR